MEGTRDGALGGNQPMPGPAADDPFDTAGAVVAQAVGALLRLGLDGPMALARRDCGTRALASSFELSQLVGLFLKIRDPGQRRHCLATLRIYAEPANRA